MPPRAKFSHEQIIDAAYELVRQQGLEALSARTLAACLGTSTAPLFTAFHNIEEIQNLVIDRAKALYDKYMQEGLCLQPPFKGAGRKYVEFAKDEPELFKLLFMRGNGGGDYTHYFPSGFVYEDKIMGVLTDGYGIENQAAKNLYNHLSVYVHGIASMYAQRQCVFTMEDVDRMISEIFLALRGGDKE